MERQITSAKLTEISADQFSGPLTNIEEFCKSIREEYKECSNLLLEPVYSYDGVEFFILFGERLETKEEFKKRVDSEKKFEAMRKAKEDAKSLREMKKVYKEFYSVKQ